MTFYYWVVVIQVLATCYVSDHVIRGTSAVSQEEWAAEIHGGPEVARRVAEEHGFRLTRAFRSLPDHYVLERRSASNHVSRRSSNRGPHSLLQDKRVVYAAEQEELFRDKRDEFVDRRETARELMIRNGEPDDPEFKREWYIDPSSSLLTDGDPAIRLDLKVRDVWSKGITGKGVIVTILDDGHEHDHPDLRDNYAPEASYDFNDNDHDPYPRYDPTNENNHGTRCAGIIAMVADNQECGVGIAFGSKTGGIRILDGKITDKIEGDSLGFNTDYVQIYSASWGPKDNGSTCEGPGKFASKGIDLGIKNGRDGKGSIYVWASGNGGYFGDNCACDGFVSSIYSIGVSSVTSSRTSPPYGELCPAVLTSTYSSGSFYNDPYFVTTTDMRHECTNGFSGTSAAAPMVAGMLALLLEANPSLTWRDVQHIVVHTSRMAPLANNPGWYKNGAGYCVNLAFGFGLMDALALVELADPAKWENVGEQRICKAEPTQKYDFPREFSSGGYVAIEFDVDGCRGQENEINFLEHVEVVLDIEHEKRGNIYITLTSPMGTTTELMRERPKDESTRFYNWPFMTTHNWGEQPQGKWTVIVGDKSDDSLSGSVNAASLVMYGTTEQPEYQKSSTDRCGEGADLPTSGSQQMLKTTIAKLTKLLDKTNDSETKKMIEELNNKVMSLESQE